MFLSICSLLLLANVTTFALILFCFCFDLGWVSAAFAYGKDYYYSTIGVDHLFCLQGAEVGYRRRRRRGSFATYLPKTGGEGGSLELDQVKDLNKIKCKILKTRCVLAILHYTALYFISSSPLQTQWFYHLVFHFFYSYGVFTLVVQ